jgi:putative iron-dependent peroxidase
MTNHQPGIFAPVPAMGRYLVFQRTPESSVRRALAALEALPSEGHVVGLGAGLVEELAEGTGKKVPGMRAFPVIHRAGVHVPSTPADLWVWLRGDDRGALVHRARALESALDCSFELDQVIDSFMYDGGRDLTGYVDGTENPKGDKALAAAFVAGQGEGLDGSSFVGVQQWVHDLDGFEDHAPAERDAIFGRSRESDEELEDAPESAHVKRTAQESFDPEAFVLRRSMPWADDDGEGLVFTAFGHSLDAYEALLGRMTGKEDGIVDALFRFTRPVTGAFFWCPPVLDGRLDLQALGR